MGERKALLIGSSQYHEPLLEDIPQAVANVNGLAETLDYHSDLGMYNISTLIDETVINVRIEIEKFFRSTTREDTLLFYFSGYGERDKLGNLHLCAANTNKDALKATSVEYEFIKYWFNNCTAQQIVIILDCCNSGVALTTKRARDKLELNVEVLSRTNNYKDGKGIAILTSSGSRQHWYSTHPSIGDSQCSVFTRYLLYGITTGAADTNEDEYTDVNELYRYILGELESTESLNETTGEALALLGGKLIVAHSPIQPKSAEDAVPLWTEVGPLTLPEIMHAIDDLGQKDYHPNAKLRQLYLLRHSGLDNIPSSFNLEKKIQEIERSRFSGRTQRTDFALKGLKWCLVTEDKDFSDRIFVAKYIVTNEQYDQFLAASDGYRNAAWWDFSDIASRWRRAHPKPIPSPYKQATFPRVNVNWFDAVAFCNWLSNKVGFYIYLLAPSDREIVAGKRYDYPWGNTFSKEHLAWCNIRGSRINHPTSVHKYDHLFNSRGGDFSLYGLSDLCGNVWEWGMSSYRVYKDSSVAYEPQPAFGGSWRSRPRHVRKGFVRYLDPAYYADDLGFRIWF